MNLVIQLMWGKGPCYTTIDTTNNYWAELVHSPQYGIPAGGKVVTKEVIKKTVNSIVPFVLTHKLLKFLKFVEVTHGFVIQIQPHA